MQLYAQDQNGILVLAHNAMPKKNYKCLECESIVRARKGNFRKAHFYHLNAKTACSLQGKSLTHLAIQHYLFDLLPDGEVELEKRFSSINRIADVVWLKHNLIFEVQCSFIDEQEVLSRNRDYASIGYEVIWILHDKRYNKWRHSLAERALENKPHYFTNMNQHGKGMIYDQFEIIQNGLRKIRFASLPVDLSQPCKVNHTKSIHLAMLKKRLEWQWSFEGDLLSEYLYDSNSAYLNFATIEQQKFLPQKKASFFGIFQFLKDAYLNWLDAECIKRVGAY